MKSELKLDPGEELCPKCKGKGETYNHHTNWAVKWRMCDRCWGAGKLDWIEMIMGKQVPQFGSSSSSSVSSTSMSSTRGAYNGTKRLHFGGFRNPSNNIRQLYAGEKRQVEREFYSSRYRKIPIKYDHRVSAFLRAELS